MYFQFPYSNQSDTKSRKRPKNGAAEKMESRERKRHVHHFRRKYSHFECAMRTGRHCAFELAEKYPSKYTMYGLYVHLHITLQFAGHSATVQQSRFTLTCNNRDGPLSSHAPSIPLSVCPESNPNISTPRPMPEWWDSATIWWCRFDDTSGQRPYDGPTAEAFWLGNDFVIFAMRLLLPNTIFLYSICFHLLEKKRKIWNEMRVTRKLIILYAHRYRPHGQQINEKLNAWTATS